MKCEKCGKNYPNKFYFAMSTNICGDCYEQMSPSERTSIKANSAAQKSQDRLPETIICPNCKTELELEEKERISWEFTCPKCNSNIKMRDVESKRQEKATIAKQIRTVVILGVLFFLSFIFKSYDPLGTDFFGSSGYINDFENWLMGGLGLGLDAIDTLTSPSTSQVLLCILCIIAFVRLLRFLNRDKNMPNKF